MSNYIIYNGELYHHGVKGMKWGVRKVREARKAVKRSIKSGNREHYNRELKKQREILKKEREGIYEVDESMRIFDRARKAVKAAMLRDAGYSKEDAEAGAEWLENKNINLTWKDFYDLYD